MRVRFELDMPPSVAAALGRVALRMRRSKAGAVRELIVLEDERAGCTRGDADDATKREAQ